MAIIVSCQTLKSLWENKLSEENIDITFFTNCFELFLTAYSQPDLIPTFHLIIDTTATPGLGDHLAKRGAVRFIRQQQPTPVDQLIKHKMSFVKMLEFDSWQPKTKEQRCEELLRVMMKKASDQHRHLLETFMHNSSAGIQLLEQLYRKMLDGHASPLSDYINKSPTVACKILYHAIQDSAADID